MIHARIVVVSGPDRGLAVEVGPAGGAIGRGAEALVKLADVAVSRTHATLTVEDGELVVTDAGGPNPTRVGGEPVTRRALRPGDELAVGRSILRVVDPDDDVVAVPSPPPTVALDTVELLARPRGRDAVAAVAALGDALHRTTDRDAAIAVARDVLAGALGAARVDVLVRDAAGRLASDGAVVVLPDGALADALGRDRASVVEHDGRALVVAPLAPVDGALGVAGVVVAVRAGRGWDRDEVALATAAARLLGALAARDRAVRARSSLADRAGAGAVLGRSPAMRQLAALIAKVAPTDTTVLVTGESGAGKEWVADAIHAASPRAAGPLVAVNCAALSASLVESELFGHEKGAFTGATERRPGRFEQADGGTLFLDEVGELPEPAQAKLLRVLETRRFERVGGARTVAVDVRLVAATNRDLEAMVRAGRFRDDLYYRLCVVRAHVPPLRERPEDVAPLAEHFRARFAAALGRRAAAFTHAAVAALEAHWWPGNVRELRNVIERAVVLGDGAAIDADDLDLAPAAAAPAPVAAPGARALQDVERDAIVAALAQTGGNKAAAAQLLGIDRTGLYKKLRRLGLR